MSETCWALNKWNKITSDIKLVFHSSTIAMMHGPINIRLVTIYCLTWRHILADRSHQLHRFEEVLCQVLRVVLRNMRTTNWNKIVPIFPMRCSSFRIFHWSLFSSISFNCTRFSTRAPNAICICYVCLLRACM